MKPYKDLDNNNSNIEEYTSGDEWFRVSCKQGAEYNFFEDKVGQFVINKLKHLADSGRGLDEYMKQISVDLENKK
jgi:hypothetical protein